MKLMKYVDQADGTETWEPVEALYFNGYSVGERMLEDFIFKVTLTVDKTDIEVTSVEPLPKGYDGAYWLTEAKKFAMDNDVFSTTPEMDNDDGFILFEEESK